MVENQSNQSSVDDSFYVDIDDDPEIVKQNMETLQGKLNSVLATNWWQKYISAAFWNNISTPLNLCIMLLTTLTTGQATTSNLLSNSNFISISVASLILSVINTFFRPHTQMNDNLEIMRKWQHLGSMFERIYYSKNNSKEDFERRYKAYATLQKDIHNLQNSPTPTSQNFLTDILYYLINKLLKKRQRHLWINLETAGQTKNQTSQTSNSIIFNVTSV
jgi:hypothetical protein